MGILTSTAMAECQNVWGGQCQTVWFENADPPHTVMLDQFYIDKYEVTNAQYKACADAGVCDPPQSTLSNTRSSYYGNPQFDNYPVIYVNWYQAKTYCEVWQGKRLPTEAEWEKASRGEDGRLYPWGGNLDCDHVNYNGRNNCSEDTLSVDSFSNGASPYGVYNMAGNVWEWVNDWYDPDYYDKNPPAENPQGPSSGKNRVTRGGNWADGRGYEQLSLYRGSRLPTDATNSIGFRCAKD